MVPSSPAGMTRRPTIDRGNSHSHAHPHGSSSPSAGTPQQPLANGSRRVSGMNMDEDRGLVMREREKDRDEKGSVGKAGGVGVGVTRPKRRLSSLPTLPPPHFTSHRATSVASGHTPPASPGPPHGNSTYQALQHPLAMPGSSTANNHYHNPYSRVAAPPRGDEKVGMVGYAAGIAAASREKEGSPMLWGIELKWISLITLALQNAFLTIIMHYSRISSSPDHTYSAATAVLFNELLKGSISIIIALKRIDNDMINAPPPPVWSDKGSSKDTDRRPSSSARWPTLFHPSRLRVLTTALFSADCYKLSVPAILYVIQNNLQYVAASNLDVATFQVTYQMKILTTAFFSVLLLGKRLSKEKWASLVLLAIGVGIVQIQSSSAPAAAPPSSTGHVKMNHNDHQLRSDIPDAEIISPLRVMYPFKGFVAVTLACMTSGLAGVYFEFILKSSSGSTPPPDLWIRNTQLSLFSLIPAAVPILLAPSGPAELGWLGRVMGSFSNFNGWALGTVLTQTFGGLITAIVIRYSDNIMKGFATSLSIIISFLASVALFSYPITLAFIVGSSIVLFATYMYNSPSTPSSPPSRTAVGVTPGSPITSNAPILGEPEKEKMSRTSSVINLLGLGSGSTANSRKPSSTDLRSQLALSAHSHSHPHSHYSASAPGTPYLGYSSGGETSGRASPNLPYSPKVGTSGGGAVGGPGTGFGVGSAAGTSKDRVSRPVLSLDIDGR